MWLRNYQAWKKIAPASILGNLADPTIYLVGLGFGVGLMIDQVEGSPYIAFLAAGMVATAAMTSATFEIIHAAFARMHAQRTWEAILYTQLTLGDVILGELAWAATRAFLAGSGIIIIAGVLGYAAWPSAFYALPVIALTGLAFASLAMLVAALARSYDHFVFYQTLFITPMLFLCGAVFPVNQLPSELKNLTSVLPLVHSIELIRPVMLGRSTSGVGVHIFVLCAYAILPFFLCDSNASPVSPTVTPVRQNSRNLGLQSYV